MELNTSHMLQVELENFIPLEIEVVRIDLRLDMVLKVQNRKICIWQLGSVTYDEIKLLEKTTA